MGNINNCITVEDQSLYTREEKQSGFLSETGTNLYTQTLPDEITLAKEPPQAPLHLGCLPLNISAFPEPSIAGWSRSLPLPCTLNHLTMLSSAATRTMACTTRLRNKFVTVVLVKPNDVSIGWRTGAMTEMGHNFGAGPALSRIIPGPSGSVVGCDVAYVERGWDGPIRPSGGSIRPGGILPPPALCGPYPLGTTPSLSPGTSPRFSSPEGGFTFGSRGTSKASRSASCAGMEVG